MEWSWIEARSGGVEIGWINNFLVYSITKFSVNFNNMRTLCTALFFFILTSQIHSQCCLRFQGRKCALCPAGTHLFRGNCLIDIKDCATYKDGFDCAACGTGFQLNSTGDCQKIVTPPPPPQSQLATDQSYTDTKIDVNSLQGPLADVFMICDQYFKTTKPELGVGATALGGLVRSYPNKSAEITIEYGISKNIYYRAVASVDLQTFLMRETSFSKIGAPSLSQPSTSNNNMNSNNINSNSGSTTVASVIGSEPVSLSSPAHIQLLSAVQGQLANLSLQIASLKSGNIASISDGSYNLTLIYNSKVAGSEIWVTATVLKDKTAKIIDTTTVPPKASNSDGLVYAAFNPQDPLDQFYLICKDFLWNQLPQFNGLEPTSTKKAALPPLSYYLLRLTKLDGSSWDINLKIDTEAYLVSIDKKTQVTSPTTPTTGGAWVKVDPSMVYKDIYFIVVAEYINKQSNNKYKDAVIRAVEKMENAGTVSYRVSFQFGGRLWEVLGAINTATFATSNYAETPKQLLSTSNTTNTTNTNTNSNTSNSPTNNTTNTNNAASLTIVANTTNISTGMNSNTTNPSAGAGTGKYLVGSMGSISSTNGGGDKNPTNVISNNGMGGSNNQDTNTAKSNNGSSNSINNIINNNNNNTSNSNNNNNNNSSSLNMNASSNNNASLNIYVNTNITNNSNYNINNNTNSNNNNSNNNSSNGNSNNNNNNNNNSNNNSSNGNKNGNNNGIGNSNNNPSPSPKSLSLIQQLASGLSLLSKSDMAGAQFKEIDNLVRASNPSELKNATIVGAFSKTSSFTRNYQIYYMQVAGNQDIYAAVLSRDQLRKRTYIISFNKVGF